MLSSPTVYRIIWILIPYNHLTRHKVPRVICLQHYLTRKPVMHYAFSMPLCVTGILSYLILLLVEILNFFN